MASNCLPRQPLSFALRPVDSSAPHGTSSRECDSLTGVCSCQLIILLCDSRMRCGFASILRPFVRCNNSQRALILVLSDSWRLKLLTTYTTTSSRPSSVLTLSLDRCRNGVLLEILHVLNVKTTFPSMCGNIKTSPYQRRSFLQTGRLLSTHPSLIDAAAKIS